MLLCFWKRRSGMNIVEFRNVTKNFGTKKVLNEINLSIPTGSIFGFIGENGAGKTTAMKCLLGLEEISSGEIRVQGEKVSFGTTKTNRVTGYLPDVPAFYSYMTATEYLTFCGEITGIAGKNTLKKKVKETLATVGLETNNKKIKGYSRGMKQRLGIAQALLNEPELLICDEPTSALDPIGRNEFLELLVSLKGKMTILFSTHILGDVERICDYVGILDKGKLKINLSMDALKQRYAQAKIEVAFAADQESSSWLQVLDSLQAQGVITNIEKNFSSQQVLISYKKEYAEVARILFDQLANHDVLPISLRKITPSLESIFLEVTQ